MSYVFAAVIAVTYFLGILVCKEETGINTAASQITKFSGKSEISFDEQKVNTVEIGLEEAAPAGIKIYDNGNMICSSSSSDAYRFCAFEPVETDRKLSFITEIPFGAEEEYTEN